MFLLPSIALGIAIALALGGKPSRLLSLQLRAAPLVVAAFAVQVVLFTRVGTTLPASGVRAAHVASYALLIVFACLNARVRALWLLLGGMILNAVAIMANGGHMPLSAEASAAVDIEGGANVSSGAERLWYLGDVFALPAELPLANVFSVGDVLIGLGMVLLIVHGSLHAPTEPLLRVTRLAKPLRAPDFRRLAAGRLVSVTGDWLTTAALIGWFYSETGSTLYVALLLLARMAPPILGGGIAAMVADRVSKRALLVGVELGRGAVVLAAAGAVAAGSQALVFVCVSVSGALAALTTSVVPALVPSLVSERRYPAANALLGVIENGGMALGALGGGLALRDLNAPTALVVDAATFGLAAFLFWRLRSAHGAAAPKGEGASAGGSLLYLVRQRRLLVVVTCFVAAIVATGLANATLPRLLGDNLAMGPDAYGFGLAAIALGLTAGQLGVGLTRVGDHGVRWMATALGLMAALFALLALVDHAPTAFLFLAAIGFVDGTTDGVFDTVVQREAEPARYGAVFGFSGAVFAATMMAAVAAAPLLNDVLSATAVLAVGAGALTVAAGIAFGGSGVFATRRPRPAPRAA